MDEVKKIYMKIRVMKVKLERIYEAGGKKALKREQ